MAKTHAVQRQQMLEKLADHLLAAGLQGTSLRPLAAAVGTSDRMLLYYFRDKNELMSSTLTLIAARLLQLLDKTRTKAMPFATLLPHLMRMMNAAPMRPYVKLWLELAALAGRDQEPYRSTARQILEAFINWTAAALAVERERDRRPLAALLLATIEGFVMLDAIGCDDSTQAALQGVTRLLSKR